MFDYFVSLGSACGTAASMSKYGFRSFSGPLDWLVTNDLSWVLHYIETDFVDFLQSENLMQYGIKQKNFVDQKSGFIFLHDHENYKTEFNRLKQKYERRIKRFIQASHQKTCFLRCISSPEELDYIKTHAEYIQTVISRHNIENIIVFLAEKEFIESADLPFKTYSVPERVLKFNDFNVRRVLRSLFDNSPEFLEFCMQNYSRHSMIQNLMVDNRREIYYQGLMEQDYQIMSAMAVHDFSKDNLPSHVIIYGAGKVGCALYPKIKNLTKVMCFFDRNRGGQNFQEIPIFSVGELKDIEDAAIIVTTVQDFNTIKECIYDKYGEVPMISLADLLGIPIGNGEKDLMQ